MKYHQRTTFSREMERRAQWMREYEEKLVSLRPEMQGKVDWDTATYLFLACREAIEAAETIAKRGAQ